MPAQGLGARPAWRSESIARAWARAASACTVVKARAPSPPGSAMRSSAASTRLAEEMRPAARAAAASAMCCMRPMLAAARPAGKMALPGGVVFVGGRELPDALERGRVHQRAEHPAFQQDEAFL